MARLNQAYSSGDQALLNKLVDDFRVSPEAVIGDSVADQLVRAIRQIAQVKNRLKQLALEEQNTETSELFALFEKAEAERTKTYIKKSTRTLENLRNVNKSAEEYVKERFGMDISDFREG